MQEISLKPDEAVDLDTLFDSLVPLGECEVVLDSCFQGLSFDELFTDDNPPPSLVVSEEAPLNHLPSLIQDDGGFDILNSYSLDDLYELLADSPGQQKGCSDDHQENYSTVIQGNNDMDLFDMLGINSEESSSVSHEVFGATTTTHLASPPQFTGLFSELISSSLSNSTCTSLTDNKSKRRKVETSSVHSSSLFPQLMETRTAPGSDEDRSSVAGNWKKPHEEGVKKKRAKAGESRRPRPKDRQMIQDRIKELRGMIPNGAKCSIDTLLEQTIRHMVFMQSLAKYANKLKQPYQPKLGKEKERTWALEVGEDDVSVVCPIIVEELSPKGQMQIEMVCEESGQFLEITQVMRGLGLNILKGVMERRQGQIWAHFIVEAKPHLTRIHVFCSLVQLFQQQQQQQHKDTDYFLNFPPTTIIYR